MKAEYQTVIVAIDFLTVCLGSATFCELTRQFRHRLDNTSEIYKIISSQTRFQSKITAVELNMNELPKHTLYVNKLYLMEEMKKLSLKTEEIASFSLIFLEDIFDLYKFPTNASPIIPLNVLHSKLDALMILIVKECVSFGEFEYIKRRLHLCLKATPIAKYTLMASLRIQEDFLQRWANILDSGIRKYNWLRKSLMQTKKWRLQSASRMCKLALDRMADGCYRDKSREICIPFCKNVIHGCLAKSLFPSSSILSIGQTKLMEQNYQTPWNILLQPSATKVEAVSSYENNYLSTIFNLFFNSINATYLLEIIENGLKAAAENEKLLTFNLKTICDATLGNQRDVREVAAEFSTENDPLITPTVTDNHDVSTLSPTVHKQKTSVDNRQTANTGDIIEEKQKLTKFVYRLRRRLNRLAEEQVDIESLSQTAVRRYCHLEVTEDNSDCWMGDRWAPVSHYNKLVPEFNAVAQQSNPELPFGIDDQRDIHSSVDPQQLRRSDNDVRNINSDEKAVPFGKDNSQLKGGSAYESSGFLPMLHGGVVPPYPEFLMPPDLQVNKPSMTTNSLPVDLWPELPQLKNEVGCPSDDEDCVPLPSKPLSDQKEHSGHQASLITEQPVDSTWHIRYTNTAIDSTTHSTVNTSVSGELGTQKDMQEPPTNTTQNTVVGAAKKCGYTHKPRPTIWRFLAPILLLLPPLAYPHDLFF